MAIYITFCFAAQGHSYTPEYGKNMGFGYISDWSVGLKFLSALSVTVAAELGNWVLEMVAANTLFSHDMIISWSRIKYSSTQQPTENTETVHKVFWSWLELLRLVLKEKKRNILT
ncbi:hypothetical protein AKJ16_DCAP16537 [Drosera capensis]